MTKDMGVQSGGVAIIGMAGRFPGAGSHEELWENLLNGRDCIVRFTEQQVAYSKIPKSEFSRADYVPAAGIITEIDCFDSELFQMRPAEAALIDPQQRLFLECVWEALEDSGNFLDEDPWKTGVFGAVDLNTYLPVAITPHRQSAGPAADFQVEIGNDKDFVASRVSYKLGLRGPSICVQTACSSSLVAVHMACQSLLGAECDLAVAGGARIHLPYFEGHRYEEGGVASRDGSCRPFDADSSGMVRGSGVAVVVLKRLEDAVNDKDHIYAVILGSAVNNDGRNKIGFTAPSADGQAAVLAEALAVAGVSPEDVSFIETHGTGTRLGDPIEVEALRTVYGRRPNNKPTCILGAIKSNIGHLSTAAGVAGLIKTALAIERGRIPGTAHFRSPNPALYLEQTPFTLSQRATDWSTAQRLAGISSFGIGGTNAHAILGQGPTSQPDRPTDVSAKGPWLITLSAASELSLRKTASRLSAHLATNPDTALDDVMRTLLLGRKALRFRSASICQDLESTMRSLSDLEVVDASIDHRPIAFAFPGQGVETWLDPDLLELHPTLAADLDWLSDLLERRHGLDIRPFFHQKSESRPSDTVLAQPAIFTLEVALARLWARWGIRPNIVVGHSLGEYSAACVAGIFSVEDGLDLVARRAKAMESMPPGLMLAVRSSEVEIRQLFPNLEVTAINGHKSIVIGGEPPAVMEVEATLARRGIRFKRLPVERAFHTSSVDSIIDAFRHALDEVVLKGPTIPCLSNATGSSHTSQTATDPDYWLRHMRQTVRFAECIQEIQALGPHVYLEMGPGATLQRTISTLLTPNAGFVGSVLGDRQDHQVTNLLEALRLAWLAGQTIRWDQICEAYSGKKIRLPTYSFERTKCWVGPAPVPDTEWNGQDERELAVETPHEGSSDKTQPVRANEGVRRSITRLAADLLGVDGENLEGETTYLVDLGLDSLALLELAELIDAEFRVRLSLRELIEDFTTIDLLSQVVSERSPRQTDEPQETLTPRTPTDSIEVTPLLLPDESTLVRARESEYSQDTIARTLESQLSLMERQLDLLSQLAVRPAEDASVRTRDRNPPPDLPQFDKQNSSSLRTPEESPGVQSWQPLLKNLIPNLEHKTSASKEHTARYRRPLADPRGSVGFNSAWKEIVYPLVCSRSEGPHIWDLDGNRFIDLAMGFGVSLFGHRPPFIVEALKRQIDQGFHLGPQSDLAGPAADLLCQLTLSDRAIFTNSGTEAVMSAIRIARTATGRNKIVVFSGSYHGSFDGLLARAAGAQDWRGIPLAPGVPESLVQDVVVLSYGSPESLEILEFLGEETAAVLVEPVQSRRPDIQPRTFLTELRRITSQTGAVLIFDEIITGFRCHPGGAQAFFGIGADLATYGKILGGGMPIGAVAGNAHLLNHLDGGPWEYGDGSRPEIDLTFFAGTFCKHPLSMAAAVATLDYLNQAGERLQEQLSASTELLAARLDLALEDLGPNAHVRRFGSLFTFALPSRQNIWEMFSKRLLLEGVFVWEGGTCFLSTTHTDEDLEMIVTAVTATAKDLVGPQSNRTRPSLVSGLQDAQDMSPLRDEQYLLWLGNELSRDEEGAYNLSLTIPVDQEVSNARLEQVVQQVVSRHEALRLRIDGHEMAQWVVPEERVRLMIEDIGASRDPIKAAATNIDRYVRTPFDLERGPTIRANMLRFPELPNLLVLTFPHITMDQWSSDIIRREISSALQASSTGQLDNPKRSPSFVKFVNRESELLAIHRETNEKYWQSELLGVPSSVDVAGAPRRPKQRTYAAESVIREISAATSKGLRYLTKVHATTNLSVGLAAWAITVRGLAQQDDISIALHFAGQPLVSEPQLVGYCLKVLPIRIQIQSSDDFGRVIQQAKRRILGAQDHWFMTSSELISKYWSRRDPSVPPFGGITFHYETGSNAFIDSPFRLLLDSIPSTFSMWDAGLTLIDVGSHFRALLAVNKSLARKEDAEEWLNFFVSVLDNCVRNPDAPVIRHPVFHLADKGLKF